MTSNSQSCKNIGTGTILAYFSLCIACENCKRCRITRSYKTTKNLKKHTEICANFSYLNDDGKYKKIPTRIQVVDAIKNAQKKFGKNVPLDLIPELNDWGVLRK